MLPFLPVSLPYDSFSAETLKPFGLLVHLFFCFFLSPAERAVFGGYFRSVGLDWHVGVVLGRLTFCVTLFSDCVGLQCWIGYAYAFVCLPICNGTA